MSNAAVVFRALPLHTRSHARNRALGDFVATRAATADAKARCDAARAASDLLLLQLIATRTERT